MRLFDRTPRAVTLTEAGRRLHDATAASFDSIGGAIVRIRAEARSPTPTLTATPAFISHWLVPRLASLQATRVRLVVRFHASDRSCHTALEQIRKTWTGAKWLIEVDVRGFFDNIDHDILLGLLARRIDDPVFIDLIGTMLKAGCLDE